MGAGLNQSTPAKDVVAFARKHLDGKQTKKEVLEIGGISPALREVAEANGVDLNEFRSHAIDNYSVRHAEKKHGHGSNTQQMGQEAITPEDYAHLSRILNEPDDLFYMGTNAKGLHQFGYLKKVNGTIFYVEEVRTPKRRTMVMESMRKWPAASTPPAGFVGDSSHTSVTLRKLRDSIQRPIDVDGTHLYQEATPAPTFYSKLSRVVAEKVANKAKAEDVLRTLEAAGVKAEELEYSGAKRYLEERAGQAIHKADFEKHLAENAVRVEEVETTDPTFQKWSTRGGQDYREIRMIFEGSDYVPGEHHKTPAGEFARVRFDTRKGAPASRPTEPTR